MKLGNKLRRALRDPTLADSLVDRKVSHEPSFRGWRGGGGPP